MVSDAHREGEFDHTAVAVLTKDDSGKLQVERHDTTAKQLAWVDAALTVVAPVAAAGVVAGAGAGALVDHFQTVVVQTTWGDLDGEIDEEIANAQKTESDL